MSGSEQKPMFHREADGLIYRTAVPADTDAVWDLIVTQFYPRTALCPLLDMKLPEDIEVSKPLMPILMEEGVSLVVEDPINKQLVGARLSSIERREDGSQKHPLVADPELAAKYPKDSIIYRMFDQLVGDIDFFQLYNVDRLLAFKFLVVRDTHSGRGIAKRLVQYSLDVAKDFNLELVNVFTGSKYSERIYDSLGFDRLNFLSIPDYVDPVTGGKPFAKLSSEALKDSVLYAKRV